MHDGEIYAKAKTWLQLVYGVSLKFPYTLTSPKSQSTVYKVSIPGMVGL